MNTVFTESLPPIDRREITRTLSWREDIIVRRIRLGWTKADLAERVGCSRTTLWRTIECAPEHERFLELSDELRGRIEAALDDAEAEAEAA